MLERESHGTIQLTQLETERLLSELVSEEIKARKEAGKFKGSFTPVCHFFGYQGRSSFPTIFDCTLASTYGFLAACLIDQGFTGYMPTARGLTGPSSEWRLGALPLTSLMIVKGKSQYGQRKAVVPSVEVDVNSKAFYELKAQRDNWRLGDHYSNPGPIQLYGKSSRLLNMSLVANQGAYLSLLNEVEKLCGNI